MAQIGIKLSSQWFSLQAPERQAHLQTAWHSFETKAGLCQYQLADWHLWVWGDCAMRAQDALIIDGLLRQQCVSVFGRSWLAIHQQSALLQGATDQLGLFPLLVLAQDDHWYISSDRHMLRNLLGKLPTLSADAMRQLLCFGQILDEQSIVADAHHLSAARQFILEANQLTLRNLQRKQPLCESRPSNFVEGVDALVEAVRTSLHHAVNPMLSLSGGLDSRLILAATLALGQKPPALCYGEQQSDDVRIARQLAQYANIPLFVSKTGAIEQHWQTSKRISFVGLGEVPMHHAHALIDDDLLKQTQDSTVLTGTGAEAYRAFYYDRGMPGFELFDRRWLHRLCLPRVQRYIREEFYRIAKPIFAIVPQLEAIVGPRFEQKLQQQLNSQVDCARAADQFYLDVRVSRMVVAGQQLLDPFYQRSHPFLAPQVLQTLGNLPAYYKVGSHFHRKAIEYLAPGLAQIPWDKTGQPLTNGLPWSARYPGLMRYLGRPARYGKQSIPMFNHQKNGHLPYEHVLDRVFSYLGFDDEKERRQLIWQLLQSSALNHIKGLAEVWSHLLPNPAPLKGAL